MYLRRLELEEFRLYRHLQLDLPTCGVRVAGENASGKSTLVEAIALLATMRSPRTSSDREVINWQSGKDYGVAPYARDLGWSIASDEETTVEVGLQVETADEGPLKKSVKVNGRPVRALDAVGRIRVVLFAPEDVALITGPPSGRRRHLDMLISQIDGRYVRALARYNRILEQRNSLLKSLAREGKQLGPNSVTTQLAFWNDELITYGAYLVARRQMICTGLSEQIQRRFFEFSSRGDLQLDYRGSVAIDGISSRLVSSEIEYVRDVAQRTFERRLEEARGDELRRGVSLVGPHRDDVLITLDGMAIGTYGSRGQQRLAVVALKLAEADEMLAESGEMPIVLLDDVLSELDGRHRERLLESVCAAGAQLILTSTDEHLLEYRFLAELPLLRSVPGKLEPMPGV